MTPWEFSEKQAAAEEKILNDELYQGQRGLFVELIHALREVSTAEDYWDLQLRLITQLKARQEIARELKQKQDSLGDEIKALSQKEPKSVEKIQAIQAHLEMTRHQRQVSGAVRWLLLSVGDGLAWKALRYDRAMATVMGRGTRVAYFADDEGFAAELTAIEQLWEEGVFALHNDMTTCLRLGDVTAIRPPTAPGGRQQIEVIEVKAGHADPSSAQMERLDEATRLLNDGRVVDPNGGVLNVHRVDRPYTTYLANLRDLLPKARKDGYVARKVGPCLWVAIFFLPVRQHDLPTLFQEDRAEIERLDWPGVPEKGFQWFSGARRVRDRRFSFPYLAPLSIYPFDTEDVVDLLMGYIEIRSCVGGVAIEQEFGKLGTAVDVARPPESGDTFLTAQRLYGPDLLTVRSPAQIREQMLSEFTTVESACGLTSDLLDHVRGGVHGDTESHIMVPGNEADVWEPPRKTGRGRSRRRRRTRVRKRSRRR